MVRTVPRWAANCVSLTSFDPDAEVCLVTAMLYPLTHVPEAQVERRVRDMIVDERLAVVRAYTGDPATAATTRGGPLSGCRTAAPPASPRPCS